MSQRISTWCAPRSNTSPRNTRRPRPNFQRSASSTTPCLTSRPARIPYSPCVSATTNRGCLLPELTRSGATGTDARNVTSKAGKLPTAPTSSVEPGAAAATCLRGPSAVTCTDQASSLPAALRMTYGPSASVADATRSSNSSANPMENFRVMRRETNPQASLAGGVNLDGPHKFMTLDGLLQARRTAQGRRQEGRVVTGGEDHRHAVAQQFFRERIDHLALEVHVEQHDVGTFTREQLARALHVRDGPEDACTVITQCARVVVSDEVFVLDDQHAEPGEIGVKSGVNATGWIPSAPSLICRCGAGSFFNASQCFVALTQVN